MPKGYLIARIRVRDKDAFEEFKAMSGASTQCSDAFLAAQTRQYDPDLLFRRMPLTGFASDISHGPVGGVF